MGGGALRAGLALLLSLLVGGCSTLPWSDKPTPLESLQRAPGEVAEDHLLDVWIELFHPGELPAGKDDAHGLSQDIRDAEARYIPIQLRDTLEKTGYWGAVRVVPQGVSGGEVLVSGTILTSDAERLELQVEARDATGRLWLSRTYEQRVSGDAYKDLDASSPEVFASLYNTIANDLARFRAGLSGADIRTVREVAELRFAEDMAPAAFAGYLEHSADGQYKVTRLPARDDPMLARVRQVRERDFLLVDTLNGYFDNFGREMQTPYNDWRKSRIEELEALREIESDANTRKLLGAAAIAGAIAIEMLGNGHTSTSTLRDVMVLGGVYGIATGFEKDSETGIHRDAIKELGDSFASEARPLVVEVEGETHELKGSAEEQYAHWRELLREIYSTETGLDGPAP